MLRTDTVRHFVNVSHPGDKKSERRGGMGNGPPWTMRGWEHSAPKQPLVSWRRVGARGARGS
ncbi:hypothetical protein FA13DRAFT_1735653 [Coprinellus micaceus]|uniref:Uncharacterized protein n=1 Tax=Coprinellus micaceus TaxID=71717 RepID=A0A4Y7T4I5_COPMI|nr:hypothetical protein FA13DRAFT_1735653 [Coprinellus micaceus]